MRMTWFRHGTVAASALVMAMAASAQADAQMPIPSAGIVPDIAGATDKPDPARTYKLAFDIRSMAPSADGINPALMGVARIINTLRSYGVPADKIQATAVFHGPTIVLVTTDQTYRNRTGAKANPNLALLRELKAAGMKFVVCGVSAQEQNYVASDLIPDATLNLSATLTFIDLELKGYVKVER